MKTFTSFFLILLFTGLLLSPLQAQVPCTPDTTVGDVPGLYPDTLQSGTIGEPYLQVIHVVIPKDTVIRFGNLEFPFDFCEFSIDSVPNMPEGLSYECDQPDCMYTVDHVDTTVQRGCAVISGTPTTSVLPDDSLRIFVSVEVGTYNADSMRCLPLEGVEIPPELRTIEFRTPFIINNPVSINPFMGTDQSLVLAPNPASGTAYLELELPRPAGLRIELLDMLGRTQAIAQNGSVPAGSQRYALDTAPLAGGLYLVRVVLNGGEAVFSRRLQVRH